jgi:hypothetical protein
MFPSRRPVLTAHSPATPDRNQWEARWRRGTSDLESQKVRAATLMSFDAIPGLTRGGACVCWWRIDCGDVGDARRSFRASLHRQPKRGDACSHVAHDDHGDGLGLFPRRADAVDIDWTGSFNGSDCCGRLRRGGLSTDGRRCLVRWTPSLRVWDCSKGSDVIVRRRSTREISTRLLALNGPRLERFELSELREAGSTCYKGNMEAERCSW